jgi:probable metal-binding protein
METKPIQHIHAHQVLDLIDQQPNLLTGEQLHALLQSTLGDNLVFANCHDDAFDFQGLIDFMQIRQKIVVENGYIRLNKANICNH